jgi:hypothetical protein
MNLALALDDYTINMDLLCAAQYSPVHQFWHDFRDFYIKKTALLRPPQLTQLASAPPARIPLRQDMSTWDDMVCREFQLVPELVPKFRSSEVLRRVQ